MADTATFANTDGIISFKRRIVAYQQNDKLLLILTDARKGFSAEDHAAFDALIYHTPGDGVERRYVDSFTDFFNPSKRYEAFLAGDKLEGFGISFTREELALAATIQSVKDKINAAFKLPELPYVNEAAIDVKKLFGSEADNAAEWLSGGLTFPAPWDLKNTAALDAKARNLLRVFIRSSGAVMIQNLTGHQMTEPVAKRLWNKLKPVWKKGEYTLGGWNGNPRYASAGSHGDRAIEVYPTFVKIGCQSIPRAEIERIAALRGWDSVPA